MQNVTTPARRAEKAILLSLLLAVAATVALIAVPKAVETLTGIPAPVRLSGPDSLPPASRDDPTAFLVERDLIEIHMAEPTKLRDFLERNRLNKPSQRKQIEEQLGMSDPDAMIAAGTRLRLRLTPSAVDVPGIAAGRKTP